MYLFFSLARWLGPWRWGNCLLFLESSFLGRSYLTFFCLWLSSLLYPPWRSHINRQHSFFQQRSLSWNFRNWLKQCFPICYYLPCSQSEPCIIKFRFPPQNWSLCWPTISKVLWPLQQIMSHFIQISAWEGKSYLFCRMFWTVLNQPLAWKQRRRQIYFLLHWAFFLFCFCLTKMILFSCCKGCENYSQWLMQAYRI